MFNVRQIRQTKAHLRFSMDGKQFKNEDVWKGGDIRFKKYPAMSAHDFRLTAMWPHLNLLSMHVWMQIFFLEGLCCQGGRPNYKVQLETLCDQEVQNTLQQNEQ